MTRDRRMRRSTTTGLLAIGVTAGLALGLVACGDDEVAAPDTTASDTVDADSAVSDSTVPETTASETTMPDTTMPESTVPETTVAETALSRVPAPEASTVTELLALDRPVIAAHAGGDFDGPHSTMFAFTEAALAGVDVLEMDVMMSADSVVMVHHDATVDRTTADTGEVRGFTAAELDAMDNAYWFSGDVWSDKSLEDSAYVFRGVRTGDREPPAGYGPDDFRIETFASVAEAFPDHVLDVEIKIQPGADGEPDLDRAIETARVLADEIERLGRTDSVIVVSFDDRVTAAFREAAPDVATSPGTDVLVEWYLNGSADFAPQDAVFQAPPVFEGIEVLTVETFERARAEGYPIWVWMDDTSTQETEEFYREMIARGAAGLIVSRPATGVAALD